MLESQQPKIDMLVNHGYYLNKRIKHWVKEFPFANGGCYKTFINEYVVYQSSEFEVFAMIKKNNMHAKDFIKRSMHG